jgi:hypothetical protein
VTGPRRVRGRLGDDRTARVEPPGRDPIGAQTELEELSTGRVASRGRPRPGLQATVLVAALALLLAVGSGVFGGRGRPSEHATSTESLAVPTNVEAAAQTPAVTPSVPCAAAPPAPPDVRLMVNAQSIPATVELLEQPRGVRVSPSPSSEPVAAAPRTQVPGDAEAAIWIPGSECANAWTIAVGSIVLDSLGNAGLQAAYASQNRFDVFLAPFAGTETDLRAELVFQTMVIRATWPLNIGRYPVPSATFENARDERWIATEGCGMSLSVRDTVTGISNNCFGMVPDAARAAGHNAAGAAMTFEIEGWQSGSAFVSCGKVVGIGFVVDPASGCAEDEFFTAPGQPASRVEFPGPTASGTWTISVGMCITRTTGVDPTSICGTWYGDVLVEDGDAAPEGAP